MAQYRKVRRNGRWITVDEKGREVKPGQGQLRDLAKGALSIARNVKRAVGENVLYAESGRRGPNGQPLTRAQEKALFPKTKQVEGNTVYLQPDGTYKPKPSSTAAKPKPKVEPTPTKPKAETPSSKPKPKPQPVASKPKPKPTVSKPKPKPQGQSKDMGENYRRWAAANPKLAAKLKKGQAGYAELKGNKKPSTPAPASKKGSTSPSSAVTPPAKSKPKPQNFLSLSERRKKKRGY